MTTPFQKKKILLFSTLFILTACSGAEQIKPAVDYDPSAMTGMPCHQMGGTFMGDCEFDEQGNQIENHGQHLTQQIPAAFFDQNTKGLPEAKPSKIVELKDGDSYELMAGMVKQKVGNRVIKRLAYNGQIPGPLFKIPQGAEITLNFTNNLDLDTTLHSHGLRLDNEFDGVPDLTQKPIKPGERFAYKLNFPDVGMYWYHPHIREDYTQELGLYGNMLVEPKDSDYWAKVDRQEVWILDDFLLNQDQPSFDTKHINHALMGRFGNVMLLNNEENYRLNAKKGEVIRFYMTNVANVRPFNVSIEGVKTKQVGADLGRLEKEVLADSFLISPAERIIFEADFNEEGTFNIVHQTPQKTYTLGQVLVSGATPSEAHFDALRDHSEDFKFLRQDMERLTQKAPDKSLRLSVEMMGGMHQHGAVEKIEWEDDMPTMNAASTSNNTVWQVIDEDSGKINMEIDDWVFKKGDWVKVRVFNDPHSMHPMQHPIHFHGQRFVVLSSEGVVNENLQWKDTTLVQTGETVDLLVEMSNPGKWMAHCHIAEHLHSGMMWGFEVKGV